jgi:hypothetical protein
MISNEEFLNSISSYYGKPDFRPMIFYSNLQEFANKVDLICTLQTGGKLSPEEAYVEIMKLWNELKASRDNLITGSSSPGNDDDAART